MPQLFSPGANTIAKVSLALSVIAFGGLVALLEVLHRTPYVTRVGVPRDQPIPFSHQHHANMGIDCRYCHHTVEESSFANIPSTRTCLSCHSMVWADSPMLQPLYESRDTGEPIRWTRVNDLPDFVYFDHSIHVNKGIGCVTCHGRVDQMPLTWKDEPFFMKRCLECHREPERFIRPQDEVFNMAYDTPAHQRELGEELLGVHAVKQENGRLMNCSICHR